MRHDDDTNCTHVVPVHADTECTDDYCEFGYCYDFESAMTVDSAGQLKNNSEIPEARYTGLICICNNGYTGARCNGQ